ncbi:MAG: DUF262 domain-containing protein [Eggerthellaceae bacterium]|nr:DUF262 domain-containing protein [Eggerthellaceae bacterium]
MKTEQTHILDVMAKENAQFAIPVYQRVYAWTRRQCEALLNDAMRAGEADQTHFVGAVLYLPEDAPDEARTFSLIDGQQRTATLSLLLVALRNRLAQTEAAAGGAGSLAEVAATVDAADAILTADDIDRAYLFVERDGVREPKLILSRADRATYRAILEGAPLPEGDDLSRFLAENVNYFAERLAEPDFNVNALVRGLHNLEAIAVELEPGDKPQLVFETLNARGMSLSTADLLRNLLLERHGRGEQQRLFEQYWSPVEKAFPHDEDNLYQDAALRGWLCEHAPKFDVQTRGELYGTYKQYILARASEAGGENTASANDDIASMEELLASISSYVTWFAANLDKPQVKRHIDWVMGKLEGLVSERKLFGD